MTNKKSAVLIIGIAVFFVVGFVWLVKYSPLRPTTEEKQAREARFAAAQEVAQTAEKETCRTAGLRRPIWRPCANFSGCFYCADERGVLSAVIEPECNTRALWNCDATVRQKAQ